MIRVGLVDDQALVRVGLRTLVASEADLEVVGEAEDGRSGLGMIRRERPDVVVDIDHVEVVLGVVQIDHVVASAVSLSRRSARSLRSSSFTTL